MNAPLAHEKDCTALETDSMTLISETSYSLYPYQNSCLEILEDRALPWGCRGRGHPRGMIEHSLCVILWTTHHNWDPLGNSQFRHLSSPEVKLCTEIQPPKHDAILDAQGHPTKHVSVGSGEGVFSVGLSIQPHGKVSDSRMPQVAPDMSACFHLELSTKHTDS